MSKPLRLAAMGAGAAIAVGAVVAAGVGYGGTDSGTASGTPRPPATASVTRGTLTQTEQVNGTLGYGDTASVTAHGHGTLTWLPSPGTTIGRGQPAYRVDNVPVPVFFGTLPLYRTLAPGDSGPDVAEVESNLSALGYTGFTVDDRYSSATAGAVRRWQSDLGATQTGTLDPSAVLLVAGPIRVGAVHANGGEPASGQLYAYTGTTKQVTVDLDVSKQNLVHPGVAATVTLPDSRTVQGTVRDVGTVATAGTQGGPDTVPVTISLADQSAVGNLDGAPVDVTLVSAQATNVLTVPVAALVALAEGGYGVQVVSGPTSRYVAVRTGMFANGRVEITGPGIDAGTTVGVPG